MKNLITSNEIIDKCSESTTALAKFIKTSSHVRASGSKLSDQVDSDELQDIRVADYKFKRKDKPNVFLSAGIYNFKFDPMAGDCSWIEIEGGEEVSYFLSMVDIDFWMYGFYYQSYATYPSVQLTIKRGMNSKPGSMKNRYDPLNVKTYVYAPTFRANQSTMYQGYSTLVNKAKIDGIKGIEFPNNWDEIPYVI